MDKEVYVLVGGPNASDKRSSLPVQKLDEWSKAPVISSTEIEFHKEIGRAASNFSVVWKGAVRGIPVAIKKINTKLMSTSWKAMLIEEIQREIAIQHSMRHPHIVLFLGCCIEPENLCMIYELMNFSVHDILHNNGSQQDSAVQTSSEDLTTSSPIGYSLTLYQRVKLMLGAAQGMAWLHGARPSIIHGQLKPSNLFVDEHWNVKVADFELRGQARIIRRSLEDQSESGPYRWTAPEVLEDNFTKLDDKSDVYSFGIVLWEILTGELPFSDVKIFSDLKERVKSGSRPVIPESAPPKLKDLIQWCWQPQPASRPSFMQILPVLEGLLTDCLITDPVASNFWKQHFASKESVPWEEFIKQFCDLLKLHPSPKDLSQICLKRILKADDRVTTESFGYAVTWFGPLSAQKEKHNFVDKIRLTMKNDWFHGDISREAATTLLEAQRPGTFLVRISTTDSHYPFVISRVNKRGKIDHARILKTAEGTYKISTKSVSDVSKDSLLPKFIEQIAHKMELTTPCPGSQYKSLFSKLQVEGYIDTD